MSMLPVPVYLEGLRIHLPRPATQVRAPLRASVTCSDLFESEYYIQYYVSEGIVMSVLPGLPAS
jgi:hypothetical protein